MWDIGTIKILKLQKLETCTYTTKKESQIFLGPSTTWESLTLSLPYKNMWMQPKALHTLIMEASIGTSCISMKVSDFAIAILDTISCAHSLQPSVRVLQGSLPKMIILLFSTSNHHFRLTTQNCLHPPFWWVLDDVHQINFLFKDRSET